MKLHPIITSLLDTDAYKFSMGQAIYHQYSDYKTTWTFKCRNTDVHFTHEMVEEIKAQIKAYCSLQFTEEELEYLHNITWMKGSYVDFLRLWKPRYEDFSITEDAECGLSIETFGTWLNTSMYEIPTLAIVNEVYFRMAYDYDTLFASFKKPLDEKVNRLAGGVVTSQHLKGEAADCYVADGPEKLLDVLKCSGLVFDQAILYRRKRFLHLSLKINGNNRMQVLVYNKS